MNLKALSHSQTVPKTTMLAFAPKANIKIKIKENARIFGKG